MVSTANLCRSPIVERLMRSVCIRQWWICMHQSRNGRSSTRPGDLCPDCLLSIVYCRCAERRGSTHDLGSTSCLTSGDLSHVCLKSAERAGTARANYPISMGLEPSMDRLTLTRHALCGRYFRICTSVQLARTCVSANSRVAAVATSSSPADRVSSDVAALEATTTDSGRSTTT